MTLIISHISRSGICLVTDGRLSSLSTYLETNYEYKKYHFFPTKKKSISIWGLDTPFTNDTWHLKDQLIDLINPLPDDTDLKVIAEKIAEYLNTNYDYQKYEQSKMGVHVCGYRNHYSILKPCLFHVCNYSIGSNYSDFHRNDQGKMQFEAQNDIDVTSNIPDGRANGTHEIFSNAYGILNQLKSQSLLLFDLLGKPPNKHGHFEIRDFLRQQCFEYMGQILLLGTYCEKMGYELIGGNLYYCIYNESGLIEEGCYKRERSP